MLGNTEERLAKSEREPFNGFPEGERQKMISLDAWTDSEIDGADRGFLSAFKPTVELKAGKHSPALLPRMTPFKHRGDTPDYS